MKLENSHLSSLTGARHKRRRLRSGLAVSFALFMLPQGKSRKSRGLQQLLHGWGRGHRQVPDLNIGFSKQPLVSLGKWGGCVVNERFAVGKNGETPFVMKIKVIFCLFVYLLFPIDKPGQIFQPLLFLKDFFLFYQSRGRFMKQTNSSKSKSENSTQCSI